MTSDSNVAPTSSSIVRTSASERFDSILLEAIAVLLHNNSEDYLIELGSKGNGCSLSFSPIPNRKKEERHQHFSSIDITLRSDSLDLNRRWQLKAGVYPKQDNSVRDGGFPTNSSLAGPFPSYIVVAPYISAGMSLLLKPAVQNGA